MKQAAQLCVRFVDLLCALFLFKEIIFYTFPSTFFNPILVKIFKYAFNERVFCTGILDLSASGFGCYIKGLTRINAGQPITSVFVLPHEEPRIIKAEVLLVSVQKEDDESDIFRFRFYKEMKDEDRNSIHRYIVQKQFETLEKTNQKNPVQYDEDYPEASTWD